MLFYGFKLECKYEGEETLEKACAATRREGWNAVAGVNDSLWEENDDARYVFISSGSPHAWHMAAAFSEKEKASVQGLQEILKTALKEKGGVKSFSVSGLRELTAKEFQKSVQKADDANYLADCRRALCNIEIDYFENNQFKLREELQEADALTKKAAMSRAKELLADRSLLDELARIYSDKNVRRFHGHPVHYKIVAGNQETAMMIARLLTEALYSCERLVSRRLAVISEIKEGCYDESDLENLFRQAAGTALVIELRGSNEEHANYASAYERVTEFISDLIKKYHQNDLCIFIERTDNPGFTPSLMAKVEEHIDVVAISEGAGNRKDAAGYLRRLVKEADFEVMDKKEIEDSLGEKTTFTTSELYGIFNRFYKDGLKNKLYQAYKAATYVTTEKKKTKGEAYERLQEMVGLTEVKKIIDQIIAANKVQKMRSEVGLAKQRSSMHMIFTGNPGSAKTTVARLLAEILKKEGVLDSGTFVECGRSDLVGMYVGWTAPQVKRKFKEARGGVLFIDEAYSLVDGKDGLYGDEAINTIVQEMENQRDSVIVIFAGYKDKMKGFLARNEGLRSRIAFHVDFPDYDADELIQILSLMAKERGYELDDPILARCRDVFRAACAEKEFGNGRFARNLLEQAILKQSQRIMTESNGQPMTRDELLKLAPVDFEVNLSDRYAKKSIGIGFV